MTTIVKGPYLADILAQPDALTATLQRLRGADPLALPARLRDGGFRRVVLTGMGSSFHALYPLHLRLTAAGHASTYIDTAELCLSLPQLFAPDTLIIAVSQSGRSAEMLTLLELAGPDCPVLAISNDPLSPLATGATERVIIDAGRESTVSCKTYVATLLALAWLTAQLFPADAPGLDRAMDRIADQVGSYLNDWESHVETMAAELSGKRQMFVTGRGTSIAAAETAGLILKEATRLSVEGMGSAAFRHGPFEVIGPHVFVACLIGDDPAGAELNARLCRDVVQAGGSAVLVGQAAQPGPWALPGHDAALSPILEILPFQLMSIALASLQGQEAGVFKLATKVTAIA
jgi:glucosamine--fructose-6-phosphate aminotransferase (isomerizing)